MRLKDMSRPTLLLAALAILAGAPARAGDWPATGPAGVRALPPVKATFIANSAPLKLHVRWSATPLPGQSVAADAWAAPEATTEPATAHLVPGDYEVRGDAGDNVFAARVRIAPGRANRFIITRSTALSPAGEDWTFAAPDGLVCNGPERCAMHLAGVRFTLPEGWRVEAPTAQGTGPRLALRGPGGARLLLEPPHWVERDGPCLATMAGRLCLGMATSQRARTALAVVAGSLVPSPD